MRLWQIIGLWALGFALVVLGFIVLVAGSWWGGLLIGPGAFSVGASLAALDEHVRTRR